MVNKTQKAYKVVICGDGYIGKTSLRKRFFGEGFQSSYSVTLGADFVVKKVSINEISYSLQIWDLAGQPSFKEVRSTYYQNASGLLLMFDLSNLKTFQNLPNWLNEFQSSTSRNVTTIPFVLIGNKLDLRGNNEFNMLPHHYGVQYAYELSKWSEFSIPYIETSARSGINIDKVFNLLIQMIEASRD